MTANSQLLQPNLKQKQKQTKQTTRTGTEPQKWSSHGGLSAVREEGRKEERVQGIRSINDSYKIDRVEVKNSMGNGEAKELICMTHRHEPRWGNDSRREVQGRGE